MTTDIELEVGGIAHGGHCVARHEGRVIFVRHALPGERVRARLTEAEPEARFWRADAVEILEPAADRVPHPWPAAGPGGVGGAELGHVSLDAQRDWKRTVLRDAFTKFADTEFSGVVSALPGDDDRGGLGYRTRVSAVADAEGRAAMRGHRSHEIHTIASMPLATEAAERALVSQRFPHGSTIAVVDAGGEVFVTVDGARWIGKRDTRDNAPKRVRETVEIAGEQREFVVDATGFWQVHVGAPTLLAGRVRELAGQGDTALELYSGAGLLTAAIADNFSAVQSVESDPDAVRAARRNVGALDHVTLTLGDVRNTLRHGTTPADVVVLDPPRSGAGHGTLEPIIAMAPQRVVYVACDPVALARDTGELVRGGYQLVHAEGWDLFPMTHHVEAIAVFEPA